MVDIKLGDCVRQNEPFLSLFKIWNEILSQLCIEILEKRETEMSQTDDRNV